MELTERNQSLKIALVKLDSAGKYSCVVENRLHKESRHGYVTTAGERKRKKKKRERTVCCIDGSGHTEYSFFFLILCFVQTENGATL